MTMRTIITVVFAFGLFAACEQVDVPDISKLPQPGTKPPPGDTSYVLQSPAWLGFNHPQAIIVGNEPFIYVADTDNDRIVMLDLGGGVIGYSQPIIHPVAIAQDKRLNLLVCGEFDTLYAGHAVPTRVGGVYRLDLVSALHNISAATPRRVFAEPADSTRRYTGVATLYDNTYYVARVGPKNNIVSLDRDNAILLFSKSDSLISPVTSGFAPDGTGLMAIHRLNSITTVRTGRSTEFVYSQVMSNAGINPLYKVQWIRMVTVGQTTEWQSKFYTSTNGDVDFLRINFFGNPQGLTLDLSGNLFIADADSNKVYRFTSRGMEQYSFAKTPSGDAYFNQPYGVAFHDKTVYVADRGNNRILRFKLSTDQ